MRYKKHFSGEKEKSHKDYGSDEALIVTTASATLKAVVNDHLV